MGSSGVPWLMGYFFFFFGKRKLSFLRPKECSMYNYKHTSTEVVNERSRISWLGTVLSIIPHFIDIFSSQSIGF